jgi:hypothetical protein
MEADVLAAAAKAVRRSGAHAVEQFSDFAEISAALGDREGSDLWTQLATAASGLLAKEAVRVAPRVKWLVNPPPSPEQKRAAAAE